MENGNSNNKNPFAALKRFASQRVNIEHCELCNLEIPEIHSHLIEPPTRRLLCACQACSILFDNEGETKYKRVPYRGRYLENFQLTDVQWNSLAIPIQLAFFFKSSPEEKVIALYPSPAGATESLLSLDSWSEIVAENPILEEMNADTEALLVYRVADIREYYIAPIDKCFELVGLIRANWRGLSGGTIVWREINKFFTELQKTSLKTKGVAKNA